MRSTFNRRRRPNYGYTLSQIQRRNDNYPNDMTLDSKASYVFQFIREEFDNFVNQRLKERAEHNTFGNPAYYISLQWSILKPSLMHRFGHVFYEDNEELTESEKRSIFQKLREYLTSLHEATTKNPLLKNVFSYPTFEYRINNRRHMIRLDNLMQIDENIEPHTIEEANLLGNLANELRVGSDLNVSEYGQIYLDQLNLADSFGLILPFARNENGEILQNVNSNMLRSLTFRSRRYGAFWPFLLDEKYKFFYQWLKKAQITYIPYDEIVKKHCAIYCVEQMNIDEKYKIAFVKRLLEHTTEFIENKKMKTKLELSLFQDIFEELEIPYNLIIRCCSSSNSLIKYRRAAESRSNERIRFQYSNIYVYVDENHYMYDFELPFSKEFVRHYLNIEEYINTHENVFKKDYFLLESFNENVPIINVNINKIWLHDLVQIFKDMKLFHPISETMHNNLMMLPDVGLQERELPKSINELNELYTYKPPGEKQHYNEVFYFDFEALPDVKKHIPFMCCLMKSDYNVGEFPNINYNGERANNQKIIDLDFKNDYYIFTGWNCVVKMMSFLLSRKPPSWDIMNFNLSDDDDNKYYTILCYAHNLMYDCRFIRGYNIYSYIEKQGRCLCQIHLSKIHHIKIIFKDFLSMTNCALKVLPQWYPKIFKQLKLEKEMYIYEMIQIFVNSNATSDDNFIKESLPITEFRDNLLQIGIPEIKIIEFLEHYIDTMHDKIWYIEGIFNFLEYTKYYCKQDVMILKVAHQMYRYDIKNSLLDFDLDHFLTASSIAKKWVERDVYKPIKFVYKVNSILQEFILKACHGGRCMTARNRKWHIKDEILNIDAVSLYPSAMAKSYIPVGKPTIIPNHVLCCNEIFSNEKKHPLLENLFLPNQIKSKQTHNIAHFIIEIEILSISKFRDFPCIVRKTKEGKENSNTLGIVFCDCIMLEDLIKYHHISYKVIRGVWWQKYICTTKRNGVITCWCYRSYILQSKIKELFNLRKEMKKQKNPQEKIIKLLLNSGYGAMMQKPIKTDIKILNKDELQYVFCNEITSLKSYEQILNEHSTPTNYYIGWFKADTKKHYNVAFIAAIILSISKNIMNRLMYELEDNNVKIYYTDTDSIHVNKKEWLEFIKNKNKDYVGDNLGQFHNDYDGKELQIYDEKHPPVDDQYDLYAVEGYYLAKKIYAEKVTSKTYPDKYGIFFRMKGIPDDCVIDLAKQLNIDILSLYKYLYDDYALTFDISSVKKVFRFGSHFIYNLNNFKRTVKCRYPKGDVDFLTFHMYDPHPDEQCDVILREEEFEVISTFLENNPNKPLMVPFEEPILDDEILISLSDDEKIKCRSKYYINLDEETFE